MTDSGYTSITDTDFTDMNAQDIYNLSADEFNSTKESIVRLCIPSSLKNADNGEDEEYYDGPDAKYLQDWTNTNIKQLDILNREIDNKIKNLEKRKVIKQHIKKLINIIKKYKRIVDTYIFNLLYEDSIFNILKSVFQSDKELKKFLINCVENCKQKPKHRSITKYKSEFDPDRLVLATGSIMINGYIYVESENDDSDSDSSDTRHKPISTAPNVISRIIKLNKENFSIDKNIKQNQLYNLVDFYNQSILDKINKILVSVIKEGIKNWDIYKTKTASRYFIDVPFIGDNAILIPVFLVNIRDQIKVVLELLLAMANKTITDGAVLKPLQLFINYYTNGNDSTPVHVHICRQLTLSIGGERTMQINTKKIQVVNGSVIYLHGEKHSIPKTDDKVKDRVSFNLFFTTSTENDPVN